MLFKPASSSNFLGLTVTLSREAGNEFVLEAGALVLADQGTCLQQPVLHFNTRGYPFSNIPAIKSPHASRQLKISRFSSGCCCIDEFDKMSAQHNALLEAMEQQSVSIAKSGNACHICR